jgi:hypothetical protein
VAHRRHQPGQFLARHLVGEADLGRGAQVAEDLGLFRQGQLAHGEERILGVHVLEQAGDVGQFLHDEEALDRGEVALAQVERHLLGDDVELGLVLEGGVVDAEVEQVDLAGPSSSGAPPVRLSSVIDPSPRPSRTRRAARPLPVIRSRVSPCQPPHRRKPGRVGMAQERSLRRSVAVVNYLQIKKEFQTETIGCGAPRGGGTGTEEAMTEEAAEGARRKGGFPAPITILLAVLLAVWIAAFFIPSGEFQLDENGSPIAGTYSQIEPPLDTAGRIRDLLLAPVNGLYGIQDPVTGQVGPFNSGLMFGSVSVFLFILAIGGFMTVVFATGALDRGIHHLAYRFRYQGPLLIVILSLLFGVLGSVMAWSDETLGMYGLIVPLMVALRYDRLVAVAVITVAPFVGRIGSTINPFVIGIGSDAADISIGDGIGLRVLFVLCMAAMILYTLWYAKRVQADPAAPGRGSVRRTRRSPPPMPRRRRR